MRLLISLLVACAIFSSNLVACAEEVYRGYFVGVKGNHFTVDVKGSGKRRFEFSKKTNVYTDSIEIPVTRIMRNSKVRVVEKYGVVTAVYVEVMPK